MSSLLPESVVGDWPSDQSQTFASQQSTSQSTQNSSDSQTTIDPARADPTHVSIGNSWSSYLSAQHQSREVSILRRATNDNFKQLDKAVTTLQRDLADHDALVKSCAADFRARSDQIASQLVDIKPLQDSIPTLQQDLARHKENSSKDLQTVQGQYRSALEKIEFLQGELREMREEKMSTETKLAALERKVASDIDGLKKLLDQPVASDITTHMTPSTAISAFATSPTMPTLGPAIRLQSPVQEEPKISIQDIDAKPAGRNKRKRNEPEEEPQQIPWKKIAGTHNLTQVKWLYHQCKREFKDDPPKSEVAFLWKFFDKIKSPQISRHFQESLADLLPQLVFRKRGAGQAAAETSDDRHRYVTFSADITWKDIERVVWKIPTIR
ncbi:hypothetical protein QBC37DRAFT_424816 [Rhypophila decipiens]|uniref:Uncharacterized protein n=1 Tax=Rhypophila decipiens TaxID=261697 RepID=A0AAN6Y4H5_9PEZI|nr:hypothetical protein QBC37DRAFT_424816 [Rhypophila decipiens]